MRDTINKVFNNEVVGILAGTAIVILIALVSVDKFTPLGVEPLKQRPEVVKVNMEFPAENFGRNSFRIEIGNGSGVIVGEDRVLTNWHVVRGFRAAKEIRVTLKDGSVREATVIKVDRINDMALLRIAPVLYAPAKPGKNVVKGERVTICGFPSGDAYHEVVGKVVGFAAPTPRSPDVIFKVDRTAKGGMSGGPAFNDDGELVGLLFGSLDYANCITIGKIQQFLRE